MVFWRWSRGHCGTIHFINLPHHPMGSTAARQHTHTHFLLPDPIKVGEDVLIPKVKSASRSHQVGNKTSSTFSLLSWSPLEIVTNKKSTVEFRNEIPTKDWEFQNWWIELKFSSEMVIKNSWLDFKKLDHLWWYRCSRGFDRWHLSPLFEYSGWSIYSNMYLTFSVRLPFFCCWLE